MSALQKKFFGKGQRSHKKVSALRTTKRRKIFTARRRGYRHYGRRIGGGMKGMIAPILGGVGDSIIDPISPIDGIGGTAVGFLMHNEMTKNIGLYKVGYSLGAILPIPKLGSLVGGGGGL